MNAQQRIFLFLILGVAVALGLYVINPFGLTPSAAKILSIAALMIIWWVSEALPMPVVALTPLVLIPGLGLEKMDKVATLYSNPVIFLFFGGFVLGLAIEKWGLHKRIALNIVRITGTSGDRILLGFIMASGGLSMWLSNTATTMMMYPIAMSVVAVMSAQDQGSGHLKNFALCIMLAIAYSSNIGGIATIIGTPPNVAYTGYYLSKYGTEVDFGKWMILCMPISILLLGILYLIMTRLFPNRIASSPSATRYVDDELRALGPMTIAERRVLLIFITTALLWITRQWISPYISFFKLDDTIIAVLCAIALFIIPDGLGRGQQLLEWKDTSKMAWGILLLFGGGICLASALESAGLITGLGTWLGGFSSNHSVVIIMVIILSLFIGELLSNVAQVIVFAPVVSSMADAMSLDPLMLGIPMTLAASCAGMLPMATPPNAIVFGSGHIRLRDMVIIGFVMNLVTIVLLSIFALWVLPVVFGIR
jgi:solute carrier family 13 (sodium-dependent dicarboxylate transporter), member 2/3/5